MRDVRHGFAAIAIWVAGLLGVAVAVSAAEHGGKEHGGQKHAGQEVKTEPSAEEIRQTIQSHVQGTVQQEGALTIDDPVTGTTRRLDFVRVHDRVGKTGDLYYSCTDMKDAQTGELLDLDFDVDASSGTPEVVDARIHKVAGEPRYTYDEQDNRIPVPAPAQEGTQ